MISTMLAGFHSIAKTALHSLVEASCIFTSGQYCFWDLTLLQFLGATLPSSIMWMEDELKHLGSDATLIKAASMWSTSASLSGVKETLSTSCSSWLSLECHSWDCAKLWFKPVDGHLFGIPFLLLWLLLLGIPAFKIICSPSTIHLLDLLNITTTIMSTKAQKKVFNQRVAYPYLVSMVLSLECLVPLPTMEDKLQAFLCPSYDGIWLKEMVFFLDSGECLRRRWLLHNTLTSQSNNHSPPRDTICHIKPIICTNKTLILASVINSGQVLGLWWLLRLGTSTAAWIGVYWWDTDECRW